MTDFDSVFDDALAALGVALVSFPAVAVVDAVGEFRGDSLRPALAVVVLAALVAGPLYLRRGGALGDLGVFLFALTAVEMALGLFVPVVTTLLDLGDASAIRNPVGVALVGVSYWSAYWLVYRNGYERTKTRLRPQ